MRSTPLLLMVALSLGAGCSNSPAPMAATGQSMPSVATHLGAWYWIGTKTATGTMGAANPARYQIDFADAATMRVQADCNRGSGSYTLAAGTFALGPVGMTKMGCAEDSQDGEFMTQLGSAGALIVDGGWLVIELSEGRGTMHFARDPKSVLTR